MKVYLAGPYTKGDIGQNIRRIITYADRLLELGHHPYVPHLSHFWHCISPHNWKTWMELDMEFLKVCDCVLRVRGESEGADIEVELAKSLGIKVYYSLEEL